MTQRSFFRTSLLFEEDLTTDDVAHSSSNSALTMDGLAARHLAPGTGTSTGFDAPMLQSP
jgi:hypothetical protein